MPDTAAVVHAKGTSNRVPGKNLRLLGDRPLFCWAIDNALASRAVDVVYIDSESETILRIGADRGAQPLRRPAALADNNTTGDDLAIWQAQAIPGATVIAQVVPTSPFVRPETISRGIAMLSESGVDSVVGVRVEPCYRWTDGRPDYLRPDGSIPNSDALVPQVRETTGLYINRRAAVLASRRRMSERCTGIALSPLEAIDIDHEDDFALAELVAAGLLARASERGTHAVHVGRH